MRIGEAFAKVDNFGILQKFVLIILAFSGAFHGMQTSSTNFINGQPERWCKIERLENFSFEQQKNIAIPYDSEGEFDSCNAFDLPWGNYTTEDFLNWNRSDIEDQAQTVSCDEFVYSKEEFVETAISKWDLVCSNSLISELMSTLYVTGLFLGSVSSGRFSDSLGRKTAEITFCMVLIATLFAAAFVNNPIAFLILRLLVGFSMRGANISASVLMMELAGPRQREFAGILVPAFFAIGVMLCSGCAFALRDFQLLHIVMGGIATGILLTMVVVPESPRWLLVRGKVEKAEKVMKWIGDVNNSPLPDDFTLKQKESIDQKKKAHASYLDLYRYPVLRKHILILHFLWIAANFSHMSMTINLGALTGNAYLNVFLSGLTELPASLTVMFAMRLWGRKKTFIVFGIFFAFFNVIAVPFELIPDLRLAASVATILARASAGALLSDLRVLTVELFPTSVRQRVLGGVTGLAAAVGISGSYVGGSLRNTWRPLPNIIFGTLGIIAVFLAMFLPETIGKRLPDSMEDAIAMAKKRTMTGESLTSVSGSVDGQTEIGLKEIPPKENGVHSNGAVTAVIVPEDDPNDEDSMDGEILVFHL